MDGVGRVFGGGVNFVFDEIVFREHFDIGVIGIDIDGSSESHGNRSITSKQRPPDSFPQSLIRPAQLRSLDTVAVLQMLEKKRGGMKVIYSWYSVPPMHSGALGNNCRNSAPIKDIFCDVYTG